MSTNAAPVEAAITVWKPREEVEQAWRSLAGPQLANAGTVRFATEPHGEGTEIRLELEPTAAGGVLGRSTAKLFGQAPEQRVTDDLRRFKQILETGDVVRSDGTPEGPLARRRLEQRPAQPLPAERSTR